MPGIVLPAAWTATLQAAAQAAETDTAAPANAEIKDCTFSGNQATVSGGAIYNGYNLPITISGSTFTNNIATTGFAGAIYAVGKLTIEAGEFTGNKSSAGSAGAIYLGTNTNEVNIEGNTFKDNEAAKEAGAIYVTSASPIIKNNRFYNNKAIDLGGAIYTLGGLPSSLSTPTIANTQKLVIYPNPTNSGKIYITSKAALDKKIEIFDVLGKKVFETTSASKEINVSSLTAGVYIIKVKEGEATATRKLIVN